MTLSRRRSHKTAGVVMAASGAGAGAGPSAEPPAAAASAAAAAVAPSDAVAAAAAVARSDADASAGEGRGATREAGADAGAGFRAVVRAAVRASAETAKGEDAARAAAEAAAAGGSDASVLGSLVAQLSNGEGELFNFIDKSRIRAGYAGCASCGKKFNETDLLEGRHEVKVLTCFHSVCGACLQSALADDSADGIECPLCMRTQKKRTLHEYLPHFEAHSEIDSEKIAQSDFQCEECVDGGRAEAYCEDCQMHMCSACERQHRRAKASVRHKVTALRDSNTARARIVHRAQYCAIHRNARYEFYCEDCDVLICHHCAIDAHQNHSYKLPSAALIEKHRGRIQEVVDALCSQLLEAQEMQKRIHADSEAAELKAARARSEIGEAFDQLLRAAEGRSAELERQLADACREHLKSLELEKTTCSLALVDIWRTIDFLEKVLSRGTDVEVLQVKGQLQQRHQRQLQQWHELAQRPPPEFWTEGDVAAGWRSPAEADQVLSTLQSFGIVEGVHLDSPASPRRVELPTAADMAGGGGDALTVEPALGATAVEAPAPPLVQSPPANQQAAAAAQWERRRWVDLANLEAAEEADS